MMDFPQCLFFGRLCDNSILFTGREGVLRLTDKTVFFIGKREILLVLSQFYFINSGFYHLDKKRNKINFFFPLVFLKEFFKLRTD